VNTFLIFWSYLAFKLQKTSINICICNHLARTLKLGTQSTSASTNTAALQHSRAHTFKYFRMTSQFRLRSPVPKFSDNFYSGRHQPYKCQLHQMMTQIQAKFH